ncbi:MAG: S16 family serine protease [Acidimicrobiia bacterium]
MHEHPAPRWLIGAFAGLFLFAGSAVAAWSIELPYLAFSPGPIGDAVGAVVIDESVPVFEPDGQLYLLTVSAQGLNPYEVVAASLDPAVDVVRRELVRREGESDEEFRLRQLNLMDQSKETAVRVALDRLGIDPAELARGAVVGGVLPDAPAAAQLVEGDVIESVDGMPVVLVDDLRAALAEKAPGDIVEVMVRRGSERLPFDVQLYERADEPGRALIGILTTTFFPIEIDSRNVGGPSAGLMYALAVMEVLAPESITGGNVIAGTGTIDLDGVVGPVGGIRQKVVAAEAAGARIVLVPAGNLEEALSAPRQDIEIVAVGSIDEALGALAALPPAGT